jgi:hypothetical protein
MMISFSLTKSTSVVSRPVAGEIFAIGQTACMPGRLAKWTNRLRPRKLADTSAANNLDLPKKDGVENALESLFPSHYSEDPNSCGRPSTPISCRPQISAPTSARDHPTSLRRLMAVGLKFILAPVPCGCSLGYDSHGSRRPDAHPSVAVGEHHLPPEARGRVGERELPPIGPGTLHGRATTTCRGRVG